MTNNSFVEVSRRDEFAIITLNRPEALNALSFSIIDAIGEAIDEVERSDARAVLVTGAGDRAFCAGADIKELTGRTVHEHQRGAQIGQNTFDRISRLPMPSVAVINGFAFGGGLELAMACTFRVATSNAKMGLPEIKLGLVPGYGGTQRLPRLVGEGRAMEMILTGRTVASDEAHSIGLVNRVLEDSDDPLIHAVAFAREFSGHSLPVMALSRAAVSRAQDLPIGEGLRMEADIQALAYQTSDADEGMSAFQEKRKAVFTDA